MACIHGMIHRIEASAQDSCVGFVLVAYLRSHSFGVLPVWSLTLVLVAEEFETVVTHSSVNMLHSETPSRRAIKAWDKLLPLGKLSTPRSLPLSIGLGEKIAARQMAP
ncbi:hypothetical protein T265_11029 [Opisthorchis viverrini]|uniref:Uncharacterized protein n=1 Tax=Opisthorchis viverrini TaxID=6198 RepID=A0A074ZB19_OPIVI|nr:hypothetical protein T265_11029 [Opisthorchis viverrini]KER20430.1 hypothetical protein T265_11029 [Opisthorchis viverrini]